MNLKQKVLSSIGVAAALVALVVLAGPSDPIPLSGYVAVKNGGTGVQTLTGIPRGNGTSAFTVATGAQIASSFTGTCNSSTALFGDGSCQAVGATPANPTATIGLTAVNGSASTIMRSDAAPALSQSIVPTWTGLHTFSSASGILISAGTVANTKAASSYLPGGVSFSASSVDPVYGWNETDVAANNRVWILGAQGGEFVGRTADDAGANVKTWLDVTRSSSAIASVTLGNATDIPTISGNGVDMTPSSATGTATLSTGCTTTPSTTFNIYKIGKMVTLRFMSSISCTSNSTLRSFGVVVPAAQRPTTSVCAGTVAASNNAANGYASVRVQSNGTVDVGFNTDCSGANWTSSGTSSITNFAVTYTTD